MSPLLKNPIITLIFASLLWSTGGVLMKGCSWEPLALASGRSLFAGLTLASFLMVQHRREQLVPCTASGLFAFVVAAFFYACNVSLTVLATKLTTAANAILLLYTGPIYVAIFGTLLFREKPSRIDIATITTTGFGIILFFLDELSVRNLTGNLAGVLSGACQGFMILYLRRLTAPQAVAAVTLGNFAGSLVGLFSPAVPVFALPDLGFVIVLGVFQLGLSYLLFSSVISKVSAMEAALIPFLEPILNPIWVAMAFGEVPGRWAFVGGMVVLSSVALRAFYGAKDLRERLLLGTGG